ncbi:MAG: methyltransferase, TrmH family [Clostridia bacterium]|jgi:TrmH family RNA methyltransferase|nr:methyltransferase, TrmH family [Clostridia bacterium]
MIILKNFRKGNKNSLTKNIISQHNPLVKYVKSLHDKKGRKKAGAFLVEGIRNVKEALLHGASIERILVAEGKFKEMEEINDLLSDQEIITLPDNVFKKISTTVTPQGIILVAKINELDMENIQKLKSKLIVAVDSLQDPGNLGTIIRTSSAANVGAVLIGKGSVDPYSPKVVRSTMGSIFQVPIISLEDLAEALRWLKNNYSFKVIVGDLEASDYYYEENLTGNTVIVIGNENRGPSKSILDIADKSVKIPLLGRTESLNASVAASILIYESVRQRMLSQS